MRLSDFLSDIGRPVAFYPSLVKALEDRNESIFICQMAYWRGKGESANGWIYKTSDEIEQETSLTYKEQTNVRNGLIKKGILKENYARSEHKMYFQIDWDIVNSLWEQFTNGNMVATDQREGGGLPKGSSLSSNTETTAKENIYTEADFEKMSIMQAKKVPTLKMYQNAARFFPGFRLWFLVHDFIVKNNIDFDSIRESAVAWESHGFKPENVKGILEWARDGIPQKNTRASGKNLSGKSDKFNQPVLEGEALEKAKQEALSLLERQ